MKTLDRIILCVFSVMILLISICSLFVILGWADITTVYILATSVLRDATTCNILIGINSVLILLAIKGIFFESVEKEEKMLNNGVLLQNDDGKLLVTKDTITGIVDTVVSGFESVKKCQSKIIFDENNNLSIILTIEVSENAVIKELSNNIQIRVKDTIKKSLDVDIKNLDIRVKDMVKPQETKEI